MPTLAELQTRLAAYMTAEEKILTNGQSYSMESSGSGRSNTRANLAQIQSMIRDLQQQIAIHPDNTIGGGRLSHSQAIFGGRR